jgi:methyltransferase (TIGR00027 family)
MLEGTPSRTAIATAFLRAVHERFDDPPLVLDDPVAYRLLPAYLRRYIQSRTLIPAALTRSLRLRDPAGAAMRAQVVVRARYAEDALQQARALGATRLIILGAGLDTFALRQPMPAIDVLEIDHPATQRWKRRLLRQKGFTVPSELQFLAVDFEQTALPEVWIHSDQPDFISWLGTTYYLSLESLLGTLRAMAGLTAPGSQLVLDYWSERPENRFNPLLLATRIAVASQGEPMRSFFAPAEIEKHALTSGWNVIENLSPSEQNARYLADRKDGLRVPSFAFLLRLEKA